MSSKQKVLFILKRREDYNEIIHSPKGLSTGLYNSASFVSQMLNDLGIPSRLEVATDNNCIDRLVSMHNPSHVIIEALWVVPEKFKVLTKLHPKVKWIVRIHSEMAFMSMEGMAMDWLAQYLDYPEVNLGINSPRMYREIALYLKVRNSWNTSTTSKRILFMPNYYPEDFVTKKIDRKKPHVDVSCFGAVRPLKNHLSQAHAALRFCTVVGKKLKFHINAGRIEMKGEPIVRNLREMFNQLKLAGHELVEHEWTERDEFLKLCSRMDIGMQCNFSETFNIVSADHISQGVPIVSSDEIPWASGTGNSNPTNTEEMASTLEFVYAYPRLNVLSNKSNLKKYVKNTKKTWGDLFSKI